MSDNSIHISIGESNGNEAIRLYESKNDRIRMGASEGTPKYIGARAVVTRVDGGVKITLSDYKGTTEEIVYESIEDIIYNSDGTITFVMPSGSTFTTGSLIGPRGEQGEQGEPGSRGPDGVGIESITQNVDGSLTIALTDGTSYLTASLKGEKGDPGEQGDPFTYDDFTPEQLASLKGEKGDTGDAFHIVKTYASVAEMNADYSGTDVNLGEYVMITSTVEDPDNAKVYIKGSSAYQFVVDMSGAAGIKGDKGDDGQDGFSPTATVSKSGDTATITITDKDGTTTATVTDGETPEPNVVYATCGDSASTVNKTATIVSGSLTELNEGDQVIVKFTSANTASTPTLKIGNTDAKTIKRYGTTSPSTSAATSWNAGSCILFIYDGTYWQMVGWLNTTYSEITESAITNAIDSSGGMISGRRAKKAVAFYESLTDVTVDGTSVVSNRVASIDLSGKADVADIPTKVSDLTNDSGFLTGMTILSYGNSTWDDFISAYTAQKVVYCRASSNSNPASGSQTRLAFMAYVNNASTPTEVEFQYYRSISSHSASQQGDQVFVYKLTKTGGWTVTTREATTKIVASTGLQQSYSNGTLTVSLGASIPSKTSDLTNDSGFISSESDPTVPSWAKASNKPTYTASEVGALPDTTVIPSKVSDLTNDSGFISSETDPVFTASDAYGISSTDIANWDNGNISLDTTAQSGEDYDLTQILTSFGWLNDVIV